MDIANRHKWRYLPAVIRHVTPLNIFYFFNFNFKN